LTATDQPERLLGSVERVTFHSEQMGFAVLRVKVRGQREMATLAGSAVRISPISGLAQPFLDRLKGRSGFTPAAPKD
jgi:hypothetical protein